MSVRCVIQRVSSASVQCDSGHSATISKGLVILAGFAKTDHSEFIPRCIEKICGLRIFNDSAGKMNVSVSDANAEILIIPNFTLTAAIKKGRRPSFDSAMEPERAKTFFAEFVSCFSRTNLSVSTGDFGAHMDVTLCNDGPVTFIIEDHDFL